MGLSNIQVITWNYLFCVITGCLLRGSVETDMQVLFGPIGRWALLTGIMFVVSFSITAYTAQKSGVAIASVAGKLSLAIPFIFSVILYGEEVRFWKLTGVIIALLAVYLTCLPAGGFRGKENRAGGTLIWLLPFTLFFLSGLIDTVVKYVETSYLSAGFRDDYLIFSFATAFAGGSVALIFRYLRFNEKLDFRNMIAGLCIGIPNYASIWSLIEVLKLNAGNSTFVIPVNNIGIVLFGTFMAWFLFEERISLKNWFGILLALSAILLIAFG
jgi:drug/metabolite transporter (DMT)-like permease